MAPTNKAVKQAAPWPPASRTQMDWHPIAAARRWVENLVRRWLGVSPLGRAVLRRHRQTQALKASRNDNNLYPLRTSTGHVSWTTSRRDARRNEHTLARHVASGGVPATPSSRRTSTPSTPLAEALREADRHHQAALAKAAAAGNVHAQDAQAAKAATKTSATSPTTPPVPPAATPAAGPAARTPAPAATPIPIGARHMAKPGHVLVAAYVADFLDPDKHRRVESRAAVMANAAQALDALGRAHMEMVDTVMGSLPAAIRQDLAKGVADALAEAGVAWSGARARYLVWVDEARKQMLQEYGADVVASASR